MLLCARAMPACANGAQRSNATPYSPALQAPSASAICRSLDAAERRSNSLRSHAIGPLQLEIRRRIGSAFGDASV
jgi:hypothetical protein